MTPVTVHYPHQQMFEILFSLYNPQNKYEVGGVKVTMEQGQTFLVTKSCKGNFCIFNCQTETNELKINIYEKNIIYRLMCFFMMKTNWVAKVEPIGPFAKSIHRPIRNQPLHLPFETCHKLLQAFHRKDNILKNVVLNVETVPMEPSILCETHMKMVITYYEDGELDVLDVLDNL